MAFGTTLQTKWKHMNRVCTFLLVSLLWSFFIWPDAITAMRMMASVFTTANYGAFFATVGTLGLSATDWIIVAVASLILWIYDNFRHRIHPRIAAMPMAGRVAILCALGLIILTFGRYGLGFDAAGFVYGGY